MIRPTRTLALSLLVTLAFFLTTPAFATDDLGNGNCRQADGQLGVWNGTSGDDAGCITPEEYAFLYSPQNLVDVGVANSFVDNGDGTATLDIDGIAVVVEMDPLHRPVAANPTEFATAPTVREVLYSWTIE